MIDYETLNHSKWECKYHVVFIPKYRRKVNRNLNPGPLLGEASNECVANAPLEQTYVLLPW